MKIILSIVGILMILIGLVWTLQGINILPGSFMTGQIQWAIYGMASIIVGAILLSITNRRRAAPPD